MMAAPRIEEEQIWTYDHGIVLVKSVLLGSAPHDIDDDDAVELRSIVRTGDSYITTCSLADFQDWILSVGASLLRRAVGEELVETAAS